MSLRSRISRRAADRLRAGHLWVYRSELGAAEDIADGGALVTVEDPAGRPLGTALYSNSSEIALRLISQTPDLTRAAYLQDVRERVHAALAARRLTAPMSDSPDSQTNAQRLIFSEADHLPGIVVDRYANLIIMQLLTQGTAMDDLRAVLAETLQAACNPEGNPLTIWERPDPRIRELENLPAPPATPLGHFGAGPPPTATTFALNGLRFTYDAVAGQKTGAFLDQRLNYAAAARWARQLGLNAHALDICTYQGGFALHLAEVFRSVTGVDQSRASLEVAERNLALNPQLRASVEWIEADAFALLRALDDSRGVGTAGLPGHFETIVLDPPAFAKSKRAVEGALRGYKELNLRALRLLALCGLLVTCSCSHHVPLEAFLSTLREAAADAHRTVHLLETRSAAPDHPELLALPETRYLKCLVCRVE